MTAEIRIKENPSARNLRALTEVGGNVCITGNMSSFQRKREYYFFLYKLLHFVHNLHIFSKMKEEQNRSIRLV